MAKLKKCKNSETGRRRRRRRRRFVAPRPGTTLSHLVKIVGKQKQSEKSNIFLKKWFFKCALRQ
jgi:hypothetical protein